MRSEASICDPLAQEVVGYWLGDSVLGPEQATTRHEIWYRGGTAVDREIDRRFGAVVHTTRDGDHSAWEITPVGALALVILLDQFTRNLFRSTPDAYSGDQRAWRVADRAVKSNLHIDLPVTGQIFLLHPFHHAESLTEQDRGVELLRELLERVPDNWRPYIQRSVEGFSGHRDIVARFGRFPHRNRILGRTSTRDELEFLAKDAQTFGQ